jgi:hypothetical protein
VTAPDPPDDWDACPLYTPPPVVEPSPTVTRYPRPYVRDCATGAHYATATATLDGYLWTCRLCKATKTSRETTWRMP